MRQWNHLVSRSYKFIEARWYTVRHHFNAVWGHHFYRSTDDAYRDLIRLRLLERHVGSGEWGVAMRNITVQHLRENKRTGGFGYRRRVICSSLKRLLFIAGLLSGEQTNSKHRTLQGSRSKPIRLASLRMVEMLAPHAETEWHLRRRLWAGRVHLNTQGFAPMH